MPGPTARVLPEKLSKLADLALDLRLAGSQFLGRMFESLDPDAWERTSNPYMILQNAHQDRLEEAAQDDALVKELSDWLDHWSGYLEAPGWFGDSYAAKHLKGVAYFSMEFGLSEALPIYSGGLGILAGDHLKSSSDLGVPLIGIGLLYQQGYFRQVLSSDGWQLEAFPFNDPATLPVTPVLDEDGRWPRIRLELPGRTLLLRVWQAQVGKVRLYLLDANHPLNNPWDRGITAQLYAAGKEKRLLQELVLGVGGWRLLEKLGLEVDVCHLNEGHAAFAVLARAASCASAAGKPFWVGLRAARGGNVFTTHTPVEAAFDQFDPDMLADYAAPFVESVGISVPELLALGRRNPKDNREPFNMAYLALRGSGYINGVSRLHGRVSQTLFQVLFPGWPTREVPVGYVTNGVHVPSWDSDPARELWGSVFHEQDGTWKEHLQAAIEGIQQLPARSLWDFRAKSRSVLVEYVRRRLARQLRERNAPADSIRRAQHTLDPNFLTLGFARRFTAYKRPNLVLTDAERFATILLNANRPVQFIVAGKAHPNDDDGKRMVQAIELFSRREDLRDRVVFLEDYDMALAQNFAAGVDIWINNPRRPAEACGTSGMKMLVNGGLNFSVLDGWWDEAYTPEVGYAIGDGQECGPEFDRAEAEDLYDALEKTIVPEFYHRGSDGIPHAWVERVRASMCRLTPQFSSDRMVREYVLHSYLPAAETYRARMANQAELAEQIDQWHETLESNWYGLRIGEPRVAEKDGCWHFEVPVYLGDVPRDVIAVQLYCDPDHADDADAPIKMNLESPIPGAVNGFVYTASIAAERPADHYTPRVVPWHPAALVPLENQHIFWRT